MSRRRETGESHELPEVDQPPKASQPPEVRDSTPAPAVPDSVSSHEPSDDVSADAWTLQQTQAIVDGWIQTTGVRYFGELTNLAQLMEEVGEVARILARSHGDQTAKAGEPPADLADELADVLFVVVCLANQSGIDLQAAMRRNLDKKTRRDGQRHRDNPKLHPSPSESP